MNPWKLYVHFLHLPLFSICGYGLPVVRSKSWLLGLLFKNLVFLLEWNHESLKCLPCTCHHLVLFSVDVDFLPVPFMDMIQHYDHWQLLLRSLGPCYILCQASCITAVPVDKHFLDKYVAVVWPPPIIWTPDPGHCPLPPDNCLVSQCRLPPIWCHGPAKSHQNKDTHTQGKLPLGGTTTIYFPIMLLRFIRDLVFLGWYMRLSSRPGNVCGSPMCVLLKKGWFMSYENEMAVLDYADGADGAMLNQSVFFCSSKLAGVLTGTFM